MSQSKFIETTPTGIKFDFACEGCRSEGEIVIPLEVKDFDCPEGCGARYILWNDPYPKLMCVVKPIFVDDEDENADDETCGGPHGEWERCDCYDD